jgi:tRNA (guanine37-N1)-methyltransferase
MSVPEVLLNGNHAEIEKWRRTKALEKTRSIRKDLLIGENGEM